MGLVFALQPDIRHSTPKELRLKSSKQRFSLGGGLLFAGALLATMYFAAVPLFRVLMSDGTLLDQMLVGSIYASIFGYPIIALYCWFFEEVLIVRQNADDLLEVQRWAQFLGFRWKKRKLSDVQIKDFNIENWKGAVNIAAYDAARTKAPSTSIASRYATKGHWLLSVRHADTRVVLEKRAKREDIELLLSQIVSYFAKPMAEA